MIYSLRHELHSLCSLPNQAVIIIIIIIIQTFCNVHSVSKHTECEAQAVAR